MRTLPVPSRQAVLVVAVLALVVTGLWCVAPAQASAARACLFAAHRGYTAHAPENSLRAFRYAAVRGADYLEMDVQVTRDGRFTLMHDETVDRTTNGNGRIIDKTWRQVSRLRLTDGRRVPSLRTVLDRVESTGVKVLLELKWVPVSRFAALHRRIATFGTSRVVVHSFSTYVVSRYRSRYPNARTGLDVTHRIPVAQARGYGAVLPDHRHVTTRWLAALRRAGVPTYLSTLNSASTWRRYTGRVTLVVTDRVVDYRAYRRRACG